MKSISMVSRVILSVIVVVAVIVGVLVLDKMNVADDSFEGTLELAEHFTSTTT